MKRIMLSILVASALSLNATAQHSFPFEVKISGQGPKSIILIPGLACSGDVWNATVARYKKDYKCYTITFHGFTGVAPDDSVSYKNWETAIARYIKSNKISKPIIIGHSIGGGMALLLAADYPDLISKIIVVDALPCLEAIQNPTFIANPHPDCSLMVSRFKSMSDSQFYQMQKQTMHSLMTDTVHLDEVLQWSLKSDRKTLAEIYCQFINTDMREDISNIKCPTLVLLENAFTGMKPAIAEQYKNLKNARLEYATKGLHFIMYDDPNWYFNEVDQFLK